MTGFMRQRGAAWQLHVYVGRDPLTGKKRWATRTVRCGKREAQRALAAMVAEVDRGGLASTSATVGELLDRWLEHESDDFSPKTALETRGFIDRNIKPVLGSVRLAKLGTADLDRFYAELRRAGGKGGRPLAPATVRRIHGILRRALGQAVRWGWIGVNPAASASPPRVPVPEITPPEPAGVARLFSLAQERDPALATFIVVAAATGARRSEVLALRWRDVDLEEGTVTIGRGVVMGPNGLVEKDTKTHAVRTVSLDATALDLLRAHRSRAAELMSHARRALPTSAHVFSHDPDGASRWRPDSTTRAFSVLCRRAGLDGVRLHDLRHYVATRLLASGVDVRTVAGRLGHRNAATTLNVYSHFLPEADRRAADVLGRLLDDAIAHGTGVPASDNAPRSVT